MRPTPSNLRWPKPDQLLNFYGRHRYGPEGQPTEGWESQHITSVRIPFPMRLCWSPEQSILKVRCHKNVKGALLSALEGIRDYYDRDIKAIQQARADLFGGCYSFTRTTHKLSLHAWGAAFSIDPERNPAGKELDSGMIPQAVVGIFKKQGAHWCGDDERPRCGEFEFINV